MLRRDGSRRDISHRRALVKNTDAETATETGGQILDEKSMVDLVRSEKGQIELVFWDGASASIAPSCKWMGQSFIAPSGEEIATLVPFPSRVNDCVVTSQVFESLRRFFARHSGLPDESVSLLAHFALVTWFPEYATIWPCLSVVTSDAVASTSLLRLMRCAFRRPVHLGDVTLRALLSLPSWLRPTLLIDQPQPSGELQRMCRTISRPGGLVASNGHLREISCPMVICTAEPLTDPWLLQSAIQVPVIATARHLPPDPDFLAKATDDLQATLLGYRLKNFAKVRTSTFNAPELSSPACEIARLLGSCVVDNPELQIRIIALLQDHDAENRVERSLMPQAIVAEAGLFLCHEKKSDSAYVGEITTIANGILKARGETLELESRAVGHLLRAIGLPTKRLGEAGRGIFFLHETRRRIHRLAWNHGVRSVQSGGIAVCPFCAEARSDSLKVSD
jgi:hypothetical protein